jgi:hypothetical protein
MEAVRLTVLMIVGLKSRGHRNRPPGTMQWSKAFLVQQTLCLATWLKALVLTLVTAME